MLPSTQKKVQKLQLLLHSSHLRAEGVYYISLSAIMGINLSFLAPMLKTKHRRFMTLLEMLVAMTILAVVLTLVFGFYRELGLLNTQMEKTQQQSFHERYLELRLIYLFSHLVDEKTKKKKTPEFYFQSAPPEQGVSAFPSLIFSYDNGARLDPAFSSYVLARLYVDDKQRLCIATWPLPVSKENVPMQKEILMENITAIAFQFFSSQKTPEKASTQPNNVDPKKETPPQGWQDTWRASYESMPAILKIVFKIQDPPNDFTFAMPLPVMTDIIQYPAAE